MELNMTSSRFYAALLYLISLCFLLAACGQVSDSQTKESSGITFTVPSYIVVRNINELLERSTLVVLGQVTGEGEVANIARDVQDRKLPAKDMYGIGQVYEVSVERTLIGEAGETIAIVQAQGDLPARNTPPSPEEIKAAREKIKVIPLEIKKTYLFFLMPITTPVGSYPEGNVFVGYGHPWRFELSSDGCVRLIDEVEGLANYYPVMLLDDFIGFVLNPPAAVNPYPPPQLTVDPACQPPAAAATPYP
jgi:hypothetical protein